MVFPLLLALAVPADLVPARWTWSDTQSLELLKETPINCLLVNFDPARGESWAAFSVKARQSGVETLAVLTPGPDIVKVATQAAAAKFAGIVLEGDFAEGAAEQVRQATKALVIEMTPRYKMNLSGGVALLATYQAVWPGIQIQEEGAAKAAPSGGPWIDTNSGFLRAARAWGPSTLWLGNRPPAKAVVKGERYLQVLSDAAMVGARWVLALDDEFAASLRKGDAKAVETWKRISQYLRFFEEHKAWRSFTAEGQLAIVQDAEAGALLSGGIVDMITVKHTPVRPVPRSRLSDEALRGVTMAVNVDAEGMSDSQRNALRSFTRGGGTLLTAPPGWKSTAPHAPDRITLEKDEVERLDRIWKEVNSMIGRRNLGARLFNVSSMLSNLQAAPDGKQLFVHLVNYSDYPV
ncbi:MAG: hypothetical protein ACKV22_14560, partial [Bryobacteraceae bacterium]